MNKFEYIFIKDNRVVDILVFESQDTELANQILVERGLDQFILVESDKPTIYSTYENGEFIPPTKEYLLSIGVLDPEPTLTPFSDNV